MKLVLNLFDSAKNKAATQGVVRNNYSVATPQKSVFKFMSKYDQGRKAWSGLHSKIDGSADLIAQLFRAIPGGCSC